MRKYGAVFRIQLINTLAYPAEIFGRSFSIIIFMLVFASLWRTAYAVQGVDRLQGITLTEMMWYLMLAETIELARPRISALIAEQVKSGEVAYLLNKPYNFLLYHLANASAESGFRMALNALVGGALIWALFGAPPPAWGWPLVAVAMMGAWLLNFLMMGLIGMAAFVLEDTSSFEWIFQKAIFILGGMMIPIEFFPDWLRSIAAFLPFSFAMYGPARLFISPDVGAFWALFAGQVAWIVALGAGLALAYRAGVRRLTINGG